MMSSELRAAPRLPATSDNLAEVGLEHFAAIAGMTEREFCESFVSTLHAYGPCGMLKPEAEEDLRNWAGSIAKGEFLVAFRMSLNRARDAAVYCVCRKDASGIRAIRIEPGIMGIVPRRPDGEAWQGGFEVNFCDMRTDAHG